MLSSSSSASASSASHPASSSYPEPLVSQVTLKEFFGDFLKVELLACCCVSGRNVVVVELGAWGRGGGSTSSKGSVWLLSYSSSPRGFWKKRRRDPNGSDHSIALHI